ncbi:MAG: hypothetical protein QM696_13035 [Steroidobacteraceae bacterium]
MLEQLSNLPLSVWIRESTDIYAFTLILTLHAIGLATVVGISTVVGLRLLGVGPGIPLVLLKRFFRVLYVGFWINAVSGLMLFIAEPVKMVEMPAFWAKMFFIACGLVVVRLLTVRVFSDAQMMASNIPNQQARRLAWALLGCWYMALIVGRLTGYPEMVGQMLRAIGL